MKVFLTSAYSDEYPVVPLRQCAARDRFRVHTAVEDPEEADLILFVEHGHYTDDPFYARLRRHPLRRRFPRRCLLFSEHDRPWLVMPGIYASMPASHFDRRRQRAYGYLRDGNAYLDETLPEEEPPLLFSFIGTENGPVRSRILGLSDPEGFVRSARLAARWNADLAGSDQDLWKSYADVMAKSRFVLCPRGHGTSTYRLFEAMRAWRVPVILSDQWVPPEGPDWDAFSLRVPEKDTGRLPEILRAEDPRWRERARRARTAWDEWFAPDVKFHRIAANGAAILESLPERGPLPLPSRPFLSWAARVALRSARTRLLRR